MLSLFLFVILGASILIIGNASISPVNLGGCGRSKSCVRWSSCSFDNCRYGITWKHIKLANVDYLEIELTALTTEYPVDAYVAVGFSEDNRMGDDGVVGCYTFNSKLAIAAGFNPGKYNTIWSNEITGSDFLLGSDNKTEYGVKFVAATKQLVCRFARLLTPNLKANDLKDLSKSTNYYLAMSYGKITSESKFGKHGGDTKRISLVTYGFRNDGSFVDSIVTSDYMMIKIHGCMMVIGWIMLLSNGIIIATFYKSSWPSHEWCGKKIWFQIHRICQSIGVLCVLAGFIVIFIRVGGYSALNKYPDLLHPIFGIISVGLMFLNPILALSRCTPKHPKRPIFNWVHFIVGMTSFIFAIVNVGIGLQMPPSGPKLSSVIYPVIILAMFSICWLFIYVYGKIVYKICGKSKIDISVSIDKRDSEINTNQSTRMEIMILALIASFGFGAALVVLTLIL